MKEKAFVVINYCDGEEDAYVSLYRTREAAVDCIVEDVVLDEGNWPAEAKKDVDFQAAAAEARKALTERGWWKDGYGNTYVIEEKEFVK